jgi:hypothetical protein
MKKYRFYYLACLMLISLSQITFAQNTQMQWTQLSSVGLYDLGGKITHIKPSKLTVFVLLSPECPLSRNYVTVLNKLVAQNQAAFYGIIPGGAYSVADVAKFSKDYKANFPVFIDKSSKLTKSLHGSTTPECILTNENGHVIYRGLIDNWAYSLGKQRKVVTEKYLEVALTQTHAGKPVVVEHTKPVGCLINDI